MKFLRIGCVLLLTLLFSNCAHSENITGCGVNSSLALGELFNARKVSSAQLNTLFPQPTVSMLDVQEMCNRVGIKTEGIKASLPILLNKHVSCIIGLKNPDHFTVLLDGWGDYVRVVDGDERELRVIPRKDIESHFTGFSLVPVIPYSANVARLEMPKYDQYVDFQGVGQYVQYHFSLSNKGNSPLNVKIAGTSCGCTSASIGNDASPQTTLLPGQSNVIAVTINVQSQASVFQRVTLETNDPQHRQVYLSVRGQMPTLLSLSPPALYLDQSAGEEPNKSFKVVGPKTIGIKKLWSEIPSLSFVTGKPLVDGDRWMFPIQIRGIADMKPGIVDGKIHVELKDGRQLFVSLRGNILEVLPGPNEAALLPKAEDDHETPVGSPLPSMKVGDMAPDFTVKDDNGVVWHLSDLRSQKSTLLTFFPKCFTGGCANHLSGLRDHQKGFDEAGVQVLAVSVDPAEGEKGQKAFADQWKFTFPMIPDTSRILSNLYGATQNPDECDARMTFLIDKQGVVRYIDTNVNVQTHGADMLAKIKELGLDK